MKNSAHANLNLLVLAVLIAANCSACVGLKGSAQPPTVEVEQLATLNVDSSQLVEQALGVAKTAEDPDAVLAQIAMRLAEAGQYEQALSITATIEASVTRDSSLAPIALMLAEAGQYDQALAATDTIEAADIRASGRSQIGVLLAEAEQPEAAANAFKIALQEVAAALPSNEPIPQNQLMHLVTMAERMTTAGYPDLALQMLEWVIGNSGTVALDSLAADEKAAIAAQLIELEDFDRALQIAHSMPPSVQQVAILTTAAVKLASIGQSERVDWVLAEAMDIGQSLSGGYMSNGSCYIEKSDALSLVVTAMAAVQQIQTAAAVAADIEDCAPASDGYDNAQGDAYVDIIQHVSTLNDANAVLEALPGQAIAPRESSQLSEGEAMTHNRALMAIAIKLAELGEIEQSVEMAHAVQPTPVRGVDWTPREPLLELIAALTDQGALELAIQMTERLPSFEPAYVSSDTVKQELVALLEIGTALDASGQSEQANRLFNAVMERARTLDERLGAESYELKGQADLLFELSEKFRQANRSESADELLDHASEKALLIVEQLRQDALPNNAAAVDEVSSILQIGNSLQQQGREEQAQTLYSEAFDLTQAFFTQDTVPSGEPAAAYEQRSILFSRLMATTEFAASQPQMAAQFAEALIPQLQNERYTSDTYIEEAAYDLATALATAGQPKAALALTEVPFSPEIRAAMLVAVAVSL